jgi:hypothetical protein
VTAMVSQEAPQQSPFVGTLLSSCSRSGGRADELEAGSLADELDLDLEIDLLGHEQPAVVEDHVPGETPVVPVHDGGGAEHGAVVVPRVAGIAEILDVEHDRSFNALDGELTGDGSRVPSTVTAVERKCAVG